MKPGDHGLNDDRCYQWHYWTVAEHYCSSELGPYGTYGLLAVSAVPDGWMVANIIHDVAPDCDAVKRMAELFTEYQLSPIHLLEAVEDMLP